MKRRSLSRLLVGLLGAAALGAGWLFFAPAQVGGSTSFAVIVGSSMEPVLHRGDLAIIRAGSTYAPGDIVLYDSTELGAKVLHRIKSVDGSRFVLKGDNNNFVDDERPGQEQIVGELWLNVPDVGRVTEWVREPRHASLIVGLATLFGLGGGAGLGRGRRRRVKVAADPEPRRRPPNGPLELQPLIVGAGCLLVLSAILALVSFTRPTTRTDALDEAYVQQGRFDYSASVPRNAVYPDGRVTTGEPIFLKLVPRLRFAFRYELQSRAEVELRGRIGLVARLTDGRGWQRELPLAPPTPFTGQKANVAGTLDLGRVQRLIEQMRDLTGSSQAAYSLTIRPRVALTGRVGSQPLETTFAPSLGLDLGDLRLQANLENGGEGVSPFAPRESGTGTEQVANTLSAGALELPVRTARWLGLIGLVAGALLALLASAALRQRFTGDEAARIAARYGHLLLPVTSRQEWVRVTELADMESLVRLAEHDERMILHLAENGEHSYVVEEAGGAYRYRTGSPEVPAALAPEPTQPPASSATPPAEQSDEIPPVAHWADRRFGARRGRLRPASTRKAQKR